jgi:NADPH2:quinone reductase
MLQRVVRSTIIDAPIERVWAVLRDFNSHDQWHEVVEASRIEGGERSDQVGCVRSFTLRDGNRIREQLLTLSDREHKSTYCIVEATVPLQRYVATVTLKPVTDGNRTFWHWESSFATPPGRERELRDMVAQGVYEAGFENLRRYLRKGGDLRPPGLAEPMPAALPLPTRRMVVERHGGPEMLRAQEGEAPAPRAGEVRIRQRAIGVNFIDIYLRRGWIPSALPLVPGMEAAGSVLDVGPQVGGLLPGDRVAYLGPLPGAYCGVRCVPADWVVRLPAAIEDEVAAALLLKGITADYLLRDLGRVQRGTRLLVHAAAGGVGLLVCAWARRLGATVLGTVSSEEKARDARLPLRRCRAARLRRRRRARRRSGRCGPRREPGGPGPPRPLDQPGPGQRPASAAAARCAGRQVAELLAAGGVRLRGDPAAAGRAGAAGVGCAGRRQHPAAADRTPFARSRGAGARAPRIARHPRRAGAAALNNPEGAIP